MVYFRSLEKPMFPCYDECVEKKGRGEGHMRRMEKTILNRYARTPDGKVIIDIAAGRIEDLYNQLDGVSPYSRKDLDSNVASYLLECAREIGSAPFVIRLNLAKEPAIALMGWIRNSIRGYFLYCKELEQRRIRRMLLTSSLLLVVGIGILAGVIRMNQILPVERGILTGALLEGLTVAAWVTMWESLASFLVRWLPRRNETRLLDRIAHAPVLLNVTSSSTTTAKESGSRSRRQYIGVA